MALYSSTLDMNASDFGVITFSQASTIGGLTGSRNLANGGYTLGIGANNQSTTYSGGLSGSGGLYKVGTGTLTLSGSSSFTGDTEVTAGTLSIGGGGTSGSLAGAVTLTGGASLVFNRSDASTYAGNITGAGSLTKLGGGMLTLTGSSSFTGATTVAAGTLILGSGNALSSRTAVTVASGATLEATAAIRIGYIDSQGTVVGGENLTSTLTVTRSGSIGGIADGSDSQGAFAAGIVKLGSGTSTVSSPNTYTGLTWVSEGTLATGTSNVFAAASDLTVDSGATLDRRGFSQTVTNAAIDGTVGNTGGGGLLTVTGTLSGSGELNGDVRVNGAHALSNSASPQTFNGNLSYGSGAAVYWELMADTSTNSGQFGQVQSFGNLDFSSTTAFEMAFNGPGSTVDWSSSFWATDESWTIYSVSGSLTNFANLMLTASDWLDSNGAAFSSYLSGASFRLAQEGNNVVLLYSSVPAVPEIDPSSFGSAFALLMGSLGWLERRARRRK